MSIQNRATSTTSSNDDILKSVREKLLAEGQDHLAKVPKDLEGNFKKQGSWAGVISGVATGAALGGFAGTAGAVLGGFAGSAIPEIGFVAAVPVAVIVGIMGYFGAKAGPRNGKDK